MMRTMTDTSFPDVFPYGGVLMDACLTLNGRTFRLLVAQHRRYKGVLRQDMRGLAILDEDGHLILADCIGSSLKDAAQLYHDIQSQGLPRLVEVVVNNAPGARFNLAKTGELIWIR